MATERLYNPYHQCHSSALPKVPTLRYLLGYLPSLILQLTSSLLYLMRRACLSGFCWDIRLVDSSTDSTYLRHSRTNMEQSIPIHPATVSHSHSHYPILQSLPGDYCSRSKWGMDGCEGEGGLWQDISNDNAWRTPCATPGLR